MLICIWGAQGRSTPFSFWTRQDILRYLHENNVEISAAYGEIEKDENGIYRTTKAQRTGCPIGKRGVSKNVLLVLTERKTRDEIIFKLPDHTDEAVVAALDRLERRYGADMFRQIFKTITVDNGSEFADVNGLERSILEEGEKRTHLYYCHPYSSWERGTNEVTNKMVRRKVPKGTNFDDKTDEEIEQIESWINGYPRRIHGYRSAGELFTEELEKLA